MKLRLSILALFSILVQIAVTQQPGKKTFDISSRVRLTAAAGFKPLQQKTRNLTELLQTQNGRLVAHIAITVERRIDHADAIRRLTQIASESAGKRAFVQVCGWPAMQRIYRVRLGRPEHMVDDDADLSQQGELYADAVTIAIAQAEEIVRFEGVLAPGAGPDAMIQILGVTRGISCPVNPHPIQTRHTVERLKKERIRPVPIPVKHAAPAKPQVAVAQPRAGLKTGAATVLSGRGELQIAVSPNGKNLMIGTNSGTSFSIDSGGTFQSSDTTAIPFSRGDPTVGIGANGTFYLGVMGFLPTSNPASGNVTGCTDSVASSTDQGKTFSFAGHAAVCSLTGDSMCKADQPQMAVDQHNSTASGDQLYMVWRNFPASAGAAQCNNIGPGPVTPTIACSVDGGQNWINQSVIGTGDRPRITVGSDGFVYVTYVNMDFLMMQKFSSCADGLTPQDGFPVVITAYRTMNCPIPGLNRCDDTSESSPQPATSIQTLHGPPEVVDDVYVAYAESTDSANDDIVVRASHNGGLSWTERVNANHPVAARRFLPWICASGNGPAWVTWYDRRMATAGNNDLTGYFFNQISMGPTGMVANLEGDVSVSTDPQCASGFPTSVDNLLDATTCQPPPATVAGMCRNSAGAGSNALCDLLHPACSNAGETCQLFNGSPKYGDYNGNACAAGRLYLAWTSATPPPWITDAPDGLNIYSDVIPRPAPTVSEVDPDVLPAGTSGLVTITGTNFIDVLSVSPATSFTVNSATSITANIPDDLASGAYDIFVATPAGKSSPPDTVSLKIAPVITSVSPAGGPFTGDTHVTVTGKGFFVPTSGASEPTRFFVGNVAANTGNESVCSTSTTCDFETPPGQPNIAVDVTACVQGVCSLPGNSDKFTYIGQTISSISPSSGPITGGTWVNIYGTNLRHGDTRIFFGGTSALNWSGCPPDLASDDCISGLSPAADHTGPVDITASVLGTTTQPSMGDVFTYVDQPSLTEIGYDPSRSAEPRGWVEINGFPPKGGAAISLVSSDPVAVVPQLPIVVPENSTSTGFSLTFQPTPRDEVVTLTASYGGSTASTTVEVHAWPAISLSLAAMELDPHESTTATITLNSPAPAAGAPITISSSDAAVSVTPDHLTIPAGSYSGTFTVTSTYTGAPMRVTITATYGANSASDFVLVPKPAQCPPKTCPTGYYWDSDTCRCRKGPPQEARRSWSRGGRCRPRCELNQLPLSN